MAQKKLVILDTDILIEIIRKNIPVIQKCDNLGTNNLAISSVTFSEFLAGSKDKIAASALHYKHSVLTQNKRHFRFISGLQLI